jgi:glycyl-tRNA synthetase
MIMHKTGRIKKNIREWWKSMVQMNDNIVGLDASILMHPTTWKHLDMLMLLMTIDNKDSKEDIEPMF